MEPEPPLVKVQLVTARTPATRSPVSATRGATYQYRNGERVEYLSSTLGQWIEARVGLVHSDGTIDLDCRERADPLRVRPLTVSLRPGARAVARGISDGAGSGSAAKAGSRTLWAPGSRRPAAAVRIAKARSLEPGARRAAGGDRSSTRWNCCTCISRPKKTQR